MVLNIHQKLTLFHRYQAATRHHHLRRVHRLRAAVAQAEAAQVQAGDEFY